MIIYVLLIWLQALLIIDRVMGHRKQQSRLTED